MPYVQTQRIDLSVPGYWAVVRPIQALEETQLIIRIAGTDERDVTRSLATNYRDLLASLAAAVIVAWNVDDADGHVLPVTPETARVLRDHDLFAVLEAAGPGLRLRDLLVAARQLAGLEVPSPASAAAADFTVPSMPSSADSASPIPSSPLGPTLPSSE